MQPAGGGAARPGPGDRLPRSLRHPDPAAPLMLLVDADRPEPVRGGARELAVFLTPEPGAEAREVEETVEGMLLRLEEFCSLAGTVSVGLERAPPSPAGAGPPGAFRGSRRAGI